MDTFEFNYYGNDIVAHDKRLFSDFPLTLFNLDFLTSGRSLHLQKLSSLDTKGRGSAHVFHYNDTALVLRHYYRGGMISRFIHDTYLWRGLYKTRAMLELQILSEMRAHNLPVPIPVAAHIRRIGCIYTADLITRLIPVSKPLSSVLIKNPVATDIWQKIGLVIRKFHDNNYNHADLNAHNILLDVNNRVFVIDFDKSKIDLDAAAWRQQNLARLKRSLIKLNNTQVGFHYSGRDFRSLMEGYSRG